MWKSAAWFSIRPRIVLCAIFCLCLCLFYAAQESVGSAMLPSKRSITYSIAFPPSLRSTVPTWSISIIYGFFSAPQNDTVSLGWQSPTSRGMEHPRIYVTNKLAFSFSNDWRRNIGGPFCRYSEFAVHHTRDYVPVKVCPVNYSAYRRQSI